MEKNIIETGFLKGERETSKKDEEAFIRAVEDRYKADGLDENTQEHFRIHNKQVLELVRVIAREEKLDESELEIAELAAIFHDIAKAKDFENHGINGGDSAKDIILAAEKSQKLAESVQRAIERHMCNTGYVGQKARGKFGENFRYEEPKTKAEQCLYDADLLAIITPGGVRKLLKLRQINPVDLKEDIRVSKEKNITVRDAALLTIADSIKNSLDSLKLDSSRKIVQRLLQKVLEDYPKLKIDRG
jgi:HD superfamily phosphodiesterase